MIDIEALAERVARAIRYADGYVLTDFAVGLVKAGMAEAQKLPAAPRDAGERLTEEERKLVDWAEKFCAGPHSDNDAISVASVRRLLSIIARLTQKEPNNG